MTQLMKAMEETVMLDHHQFAVIDPASEADLRTPPYPSFGQWLSTGVAALAIRSEQDIINAALRMESWNGPAPLPEHEWPRNAIVSLALPSGTIDADQLTAGGKPGVFTLPSPGEYQDRVCWHELELPRRYLRRSCLSSRRM